MLQDKQNNWFCNILSTNPISNLPPPAIVDLRRIEQLISFVLFWLRRRAWGKPFFLPIFRTYGALTVPKMKFGFWMLFCSGKFDFIPLVCNEGLMVSRLQRFSVFFRPKGRSLISWVSIADGHWVGSFSLGCTVRITFEQWQGFCSGPITQGYSRLTHKRLFHNMLYINKFILNCLMLVTKNKLQDAVSRWLGANARSKIGRFPVTRTLHQMYHNPEAGWIWITPGEPAKPGVYEQDPATTPKRVEHSPDFWDEFKLCFFY